MKIDSVDFFYLAMPVVTTAGDGSQDALVVRVQAGGHVGWGECEAAPLPSIAAFVCPMSHGACRPVSASVLGETLDGPEDIQRIAAVLAFNSMDLLQAAHTWSGIEIALWDLLGRRVGEPVWRLLGGRRAHPKVPYASMLFGSDAQSTLEAVQDAVAAGFRAVKVGWGSFGQGSVEADADQLAAAREGLGPDGFLLVDAGQIWVDDVSAAAARLPALQQAGATWIEEPFLPLAYRAHAELSAQSNSVGVAGGEGAHSVHMATNLIDYGAVRFVQIDTGRIGGIGPATEVADYAAARDIAFVNHTFTSQLALSASLQPFAALADHRICEFPFAPSELARTITSDRLEIDDGELQPLDAPGLGLHVDLAAIKPYLHQVEILVDGRPLYADHHLGGTPVANSEP
jgi:L-alanine-DL-glutamate epimerase-like enolase superfamily enzyme